MKYEKVVNGWDVKVYDPNDYEKPEALGGSSYLPINHRRISYDWWFQYYRGQSTNLGYNTFIYSFITGKIVGFLNPQKYSWSIRI